VFVLIGLLGLGNYGPPGNAQNTRALHGLSLKQNAPGPFQVIMDESLGITVPVALHLDHGTYEGAKACIEAGFTSIMFDGSHYPIEENIAKTRELVELAHDKGLSIEAEVGSIGGVEDGVVGNGEIADPEECAKITALGRLPGCRHRQYPRHLPRQLEGPGL